MFGGTDVAGGTVDSIRITAFPTNATSITIDGVTYTSATFPAGGITVVAPAGVPTVPIDIDPIDGGVTVAIPYVTKDNAGIESTTPGVVNVPFTPTYTISGNVYNDTNGSTDNTVNGTGTNAGGLNAILVDNSGTVVATVAVNPDGTYSFENVSPGNYTVLLSTNFSAPGSAAPSPSLPSTWASTGEFNGTGVGSDGTVNGTSATITVGSSNVSNGNFGIEQTSSAQNITATGQGNPGGTNNATVLPTTFGGSDPSPSGTITGIKITAFPTNATSITIDGTVYLPTDPIWGTGGVNVASNSSGQPTVPNFSRSIDGPSVTVSIPYVTIDNAGLPSTIPGTANIPFFQTLPVKFISFTANKINNSSVLNFTIAEAFNGSVFTIERSINGTTFTSIGTINGTNATSYNFYDYAVVENSKNYYRIKEIDI